MAPRVRSSLAQATVTMLAVIATAAVSLLIAPDPGPAVLGAMLCLTLSRSQLERTARGRLEAGLALPMIGLLSAGVGFLLVHVRVAGAVAYVGGMFLSIWLRRFGEVARRLGGLLALPFIALLVAPNPVPRGIHSPVAVFIPAAVAVLAFAWVTVLQLAAMRIGMLPRPRRAIIDAAPPRPRRVSAMRPDPSTRLAIQMALSLAVAFTLGFLVFPTRWAWIVLTVVVVAVGNAGRADVLFKGINRIVGAAIGTVIALGSLTLPSIGGANLATILLLLAVIFIGLVLRPFGYLWWALFFTVALTLLQDLANSTPQRAFGPLLGERLEEILLGTVVALVVAWVVLPLRSENTVRGRIAEVLGALQEVLADRTPAALAALDTASTRLARVSPPYDAWRRLTRGSRRVRASGWIATTRDAVELATEGGPEHGPDRETPAALRALGQARRAVREPESLQPALERLRATLAGEPV